MKINRLFTQHASHKLRNKTRISGDCTSFPEAMRSGGKRMPSCTEVAALHLHPTTDDNKCINDIGIK